MTESDVPPWRTPEEWNALVESLGLARLLVVIESRMSRELLRRVAPEDILQESLLRAWQDREQCEWRGIRAFRAWFLTVVDRRLRDAVDREMAIKRGGRENGISLSGASADSTSGGKSIESLLIASSTPSRLAVLREQATAMREALEALPLEVRDVVRLRLIEECSCESTAEKLGLGLSAVKHRSRKGAKMYLERLAREFASRSGSPRETS